MPRKNIKSFCGKPIIAYAIQVAKKSGLFDKIIVSTEDDEVICVSRALGAEVPFRRPAKLADNVTPTVPVVAHAIEACGAIGGHYEYVCCIYPTAPFVQVRDLRSVLELLKTTKTDYAFPIAEFPSAIQRALRRCHDNRMEPFYPEYEKARTQDLERAFYDPGQFYWGTVNSWLTHKEIHSNGAGLLIPAWRAIDIDTPDDWQRAEAIYLALNARLNKDE